MSHAIQIKLEPQAYAAGPRSTLAMNHVVLFKSIPPSYVPLYPVSFET